MKSFQFDITKVVNAAWLKAISDTDSELRFGNKGSLNVDADKNTFMILRPTKVVIVLILSYIKRLQKTAKKRLHGHHKTASLIAIFLTIKNKSVNMFMKTSSGKENGKLLRSQMVLGAKCVLKTVLGSTA